MWRFFKKNKQEEKEPEPLSSQRSSTWFSSAKKDLSKAQELLQEDPDLASFMAWQAVRRAFKALEKRAGKRLGESSFVKLLQSFPEGKLAAKPVHDAALLLDHFKRLASHDDIFLETTLRLGPLGREDGRRVIEAARTIINFLEHRLR